MVKYEHDWNYYHFEKVMDTASVFLFMNFASVETIEIGIILKQRLVRSSGLTRKVRPHVKIVDKLV
jgi:hypothetical protein